MTPAPITLYELNQAHKLVMDLKTSIRVIAAAAGMLALSGCSLPAPVTISPPQDAEITTTQVIRVVPAAIPAETRAGSCWTNALSVARDDAWRCMTAGGAIYDPCFTSPANLGEPVVVCGIDPAQGSSGFVLALSEPLPAPQITESDQPWLVELENGVFCRAITGSRPAKGAQAATYGCDDLTYLFGDVQQGAIWTAQRAEIALSDQGSVAGEPETVRIHTAWQ